MLGEISIFIEVARYKSFFTVAKLHNSHRTTIARKIETLEQKIGHQLITVHNNKNITLTDYGKDLYAQFSTPINKLNEMLLDYQSDSLIQGEITLVISPVLEQLILDDSFWEAVAAHPDLRVNVFNNYYNDHGHLVNFDIGCTVHVPQVDYFIQQKNRTLNLGLYASKERILSQQVPRNIMELQEQQDQLVKYFWLGTKLIDNGVIQHTNGQQFILNFEQNKFGSMNFGVGLLFAKRGLGICALPIDDYSRVERILPEYTISYDVSIYVVQPSPIKSARKNFILELIKERIESQNVETSA